MSIITTGINIVTTGVNNATAKLKAFGQEIAQVGKVVDRFTSDYDKNMDKVRKSSITLSQGLTRNWQKEYRSALSGMNRDTEKALQYMETQYDRHFRNIGNKYQSMVMGSVALSMSGIGVMNWGQGALGFTKTALDQAKEFETVMSQIQFYGKKTKEEMESIQKDIFKMGFDLPVKTSEVASAVLSAQKLGYDDTKDASIMAKEASKIQFMSLDKLDGEESMKYISHMRKLTRTPIEETYKLTDKLTMASDVSAASIDSLWKTIQSSRTSFDALNTDIDTFLTLAGVMADRLQPRQAGMALSSFGGGIMMGEKAAREDRGTRGAYYKQLQQAMGGKTFDDYGGDTLAYISDVATKSREIWTDHAERMGNLQSIFGKSALDLFMAVDAYTSETGRSMVEMREEIRNADGHAEKLIETIMNGSYGTEKRLEAVIEQFQILFGQTLRPAFNSILKGITAVIGKINEFFLEHPKIAKFIGYFVAIGGILLTATGSVMLFVGGLLAIYASIANVIIQMARNIRVVHLLGQGYSTAGQMLKGQFLGPLNMVGRTLLKFSGITFFMYMAWKNDFLRMRTTLVEWYDYTKKGLERAKDMFAKYGAMSAKEWRMEFASAVDRGDMDNWFTRTGLKLAMLMDGIRDIWKDGTLDIERYHKLNDAGLLGFIEKVYEIKTAVTDFWKGFQVGVGEGLRLLKDMLSPLIPIFEWVRNKIMDILNHFGYFENTSKGITSLWEKWGATAGTIVGSVLAIKIGLWAWWKAIKLIISPFVLLGKIIKRIWDTLKLIKDIKLGSKLAGMAGWLLPKPIRNVGKNVRDTNRQGMHSDLPWTKDATGKQRYEIRQKGKWYEFGKNREYRQWKKEMERSPVYKEGKSGSSRRIVGRGIRGRMTDLWLGRQYAPDQKTDKLGRKYHSIRTMEGGTTRTTAEGTVKGRQVRTGRGVKGFLQGIGHLMMGRKQGIVAGGGANQAINATRGADLSKSAGKGMGITNLFKGAGKGMTGVAKGLGKGLLKGLGTVLTKGIPLLFKGIFRLIPVLGWALFVWDAISLIWGNWDFIVKAGQWAWDKIKQFGVLVWEGIKSIASTSWDWITGVASTSWEWTKTKASEIWTSIKDFAIGIWNGIGSWARGIWEGIKNYAVTKWNEITTWASTKWEEIKTKALGLWDSFKAKATEKWEEIKGIASTKIEEMKSLVGNIWNNLKSKFVEKWTEIKNFATNNPITQGIKTVVQKAGNALGFRTGLWNVPKENYPAYLHKGEMVLTQKEAQILRSMVGSDKNSIARTLLEKQGGGGVENISIKQPPKKTINAVFKKQDEESNSKTSGNSGNTTITFGEGAIKIEIANASPSEIKKGAKQMFEEFKRLVELENMKNYRPARPRKV